MSPGQILDAALSPALLHIVLTSCGIIFALGGTHRLFQEAVISIDKDIEDKERMHFVNVVETFNGCAAGLASAILILIRVFAPIVAVIVAISLPAGNFEIKLWQGMIAAYTTIGSLVLTQRFVLRGEELENRKLKKGLLSIDSLPLSAEAENKYIDTYFLIKELLQIEPAGGEMQNFLNQLREGNIRRRQAALLALILKGQGINQAKKIDTRNPNLEELANTIQTIISKVPHA